MSTFDICQRAYDSREPDSYWDDSWMADEPKEDEDDDEADYPGISAQDKRHT